MENTYEVAGYRGCRPTFVLYWFNVAMCLSSGQPLWLRLMLYYHEKALATLEQPEEIVTLERFR